MAKIKIDREALADDIGSAVSKYQEALSNWNGDDDGPFEKAESGLGAEIDAALYKHIYSQL